MPPQSDGTRGFCFGGLFHTPGAWERHRFNGGAVAVCFEGCCGGMCWPRERPATHAAAGAAARGVRGDWGILLRLDWEPLRGHGLTTGVVRHACRHRVTARGVFGLGGLFCGFVGGAVAVCFEGCCGSMCWPVDRPGTHAAAGAAARGALIFCFGDCFTRSGAASQPQPPVERLHEGLGGLGDLIRCAGRAQERPFGAVTPLERRDEYYALFVFVGGAVAVCSEGGCASKH